MVQQHWGSSIANKTLAEQHIFYVSFAFTIWSPSNAPYYFDWYRLFSSRQLTASAEKDSTILAIDNVANDSYPISILNQATKQPQT